MLRRDGVIAAVSSWLDSDVECPVLVVVGEPGSGKSTLAAQLTEVLASTRSGRNRLAATVLRPGGSGAPPTAEEVVGQLAGYAEAAKPEQAASAKRAMSRPIHVTNDIGIAAHATVGKLTGVDITVTSTRAEETYQQLVVPVLADGVDDEPVLVVIDALDEADDTTLTELITAIANTSLPAPAGIRWVLTTRPGHPLARHPQVDTIDLDEHSGDLDRWLTQQLAGQFPAATIDAAVETCDGNFLVAHHLLIDLADDPGIDPATWINTPGLTGVYQRFTHRLTEELSPADLEAHLWALTLVAAAGPDGTTPDTLTARSELPTHQIRTILRAATAFLTQHPNGRHATYHPTYADHLLNPTDPDDPTRAQRARDAHWATATHQITSGLDHLSVLELTRLPWHLTRTLDLTPQGPDHTHQEQQVLIAAWGLYNTADWLTHAHDRIGPSHTTNPDHQKLTTLILNHIAQLDPHPTQHTLTTRSRLAWTLLGSENHRHALDGFRAVRDGARGATPPIERLAAGARFGIVAGLLESGRPREAAEHWAEVEAEQLDAEPFSYMADLVGLADGDAEPSTAVTFISELFRKLDERGACPQSIRSVYAADPLDFAAAEQLLDDLTHDIERNSKDWLEAKSFLLVRLWETQSATSSREEMQEAPAILAEMARELSQESEESLGPNAPLTLRSLRMAGVCSSAAGYHAEAAEFYQRALDRQESLGPDSSELVCELRISLAFELEEEGYWDAAAAQWRRVVSDRLRCEGPGSAPVVEAMARLATSLAKAQRTDEAIVELERVLEVVAETDQHTDTAFSVTLLLASLLRRCDRHEVAVRMLGDQVDRLPAQPEAELIWAALVDSYRHGRIDRLADLGPVRNPYLASDTPRRTVRPRGAARRLHQKLDALAVACLAQPRRWRDVSTRLDALVDALADWSEQGFNAAVEDALWSPISVAGFQPSAEALWDSMLAVERIAWLAARGDPAAYSYLYSDRGELA